MSVSGPSSGLTSAITWEDDDTAVVALVVIDASGAEERHIDVVDGGLKARVGQS